MRLSSSERRWWAIWCWLLACGSLGAETALQVAPDGHHLLKDGKSFFYLADTAWELFSRTTREEAVEYLENRKAKGFTVIQTAFLALAEGPNAYGQKPVEYARLRPLLTPGDDPLDRTAYDYWDHVDFVLQEAAKRGLVVAIAPFRQQLMPKSKDDLANYGVFLRDRYARAQEMIWLIGFDPSSEQINQEKDAYRLLAQTISTGGKDIRPFLTFHPAGPNSSSRWFHQDSWLRFNMVQSGHRRDMPSWTLIEEDYRREPPKPVLDGEATYEGHPLSGLPRDRTTGKKPLSDEADVRKYAYWNLLAGACGHTYGHHSVWQFYVPGRHRESYEAVLGWRRALDAPGAQQMRHVRALFESRPWLTLRPAPSLVESALDEPRHLAAAQGDNYALIYSAEGAPFTVAMQKLRAERVNASWFDPRTGVITDAGHREDKPRESFSPPTKGRGCDWVLILDKEKNE